MQPIGARVQAGRQDDDLADTRGDRLGEEGVEEVGAHGLVGAHVLEDRGDFGVGVGDLGDELLARHELPHACAAPATSSLGIRIADQRVGLAVSAARAAATITAVEPTLVAMSQVSSVQCASELIVRTCVPKKLAELYEL